MQLIDGKSLAATIRASVADDIRGSGTHPKLAVLLVGDDAASHTYVRLKEKAAQEVGIATEILKLPKDAPDAELLAYIEKWNADPSVTAILVQLPLPDGHDTDAVIRAIDPAKDADGFHPENIAALQAGTATIIPPLHEGILRLIGQTDVPPNRTQAVIIANSDVFADPLRQLLKTAGAFVQTFTPEDLQPQVVREAGIIVVAVGKPRFLTRYLVKSGACVIDVGTNSLSDGTLVGDADAENLKDLPGWITPVPGGVGRMTIAMLLKNVSTLPSPLRRPRAGDAVA